MRASDTPSLAPPLLRPRLSDLAVAAAAAAVVTAVVQTRRTAARDAQTRAVLARRLHDGPLQGLHALRLSLGPDPDPALARGLLDASREVRRVTEELRRVPLRAPFPTDR